MLSSVRLKGEDFLVNFDTTALVALVSGIANGCAERLLEISEIVLEEKFKGNTVFVIAQVLIYLPLESYLNSIYHNI